MPRCRISSGGDGGGGNGGGGGDGDDGDGCVFWPDAREMAISRMPAPEPMQGANASVGASGREITATIGDHGRPREIMGDHGRQ